MKSTWYSLAWKEWHEHKWKFASIVALMLCSSLPSIVRNEIDRFGMATAMVVMLAILLPVFVGVAAAANERSRGTVAFLQALPVPIWRVALLKLLYGLFTVIAPILITMGLLYICGQFLEHPIAEREVPLFRTGSWYLDNTLLCVLMAGSIFIWTATTGVNRKDEVSAGAIALAAMVGWSTLMVLLVEKTPIFGSMLPFEIGALSTTPTGPALADMFLPKDWDLQYAGVAFAVALVMHLALATWYIKRFGRIENVDVRSPQQAVRMLGRPDWLAPPRASWLSAIIWKQFRESGPIVAAGLAGVVAVVTFVTLADSSNFSVYEVGRTLVVTTIYLGFAAALVVGIGVFLNDLTPQINTFWRSRPINPNSWFWIKLVSGWLVLVLSFAVPLVVAGAIYWKTELRPTIYDWHAVFFVLVPLAMFASAVAMTCVVRHAVYAAILGLAFFYSGTTFVWLVKQLGTLVGISSGGFTNLVELTAEEVALGFVVTIIGGTILAWLGVRNDWGWRGRN